jgi:hypothetical protein
MAKYSRDLDSALVEKVKTVATQFALKERGVKVEAIKLIKGSTYGEVMKANELTKLFTGEDDIVAVALYEDLFDKIDEKMQYVLIENLLEQIVVEETKDGGYKIKIEKPQINLGLSTYHRYGNVATQNLEAALLILDQMAEQEKELKEMRKAENALKKKQNKGKRL